MTDPLASASLDRYTLDSVLGRGGMGVVYKARDHVRNETVALKRLMLDERANEQQRDRMITSFEREYYSLSELKHPHIIAVYGYGQDEVAPYYTMKLLQGQSLRASSPLPYREACHLLRDVASALALLHSRSLNHRDVSPLNVHCTSGDAAKLIDFGAMMPNGVPRAVIGTPAFIAPECLQQASLDGRGITRANPGDTDAAEGCRPDRACMSRHNACRDSSLG